MSHAAIDEAVQLRNAIEDADTALANAKQAGVVDFRAVSDLKRRRETLISELEMAEAKAR